MMFRKSYDIAVCGGGIAGVSAAVAAARMGCKTLLIEKTLQPGGLAANGLVLVYLPLCDGNGNQLLYGLPEELMRLSNKYGPCRLDENWREKNERMQVNFSPASCVLALDEVLEDAGVDVWLDTVITGVQVDDHRLKAVEIFNKSGFGTIEAGCFIDATGDADVAHLSGNACRNSANAMVLWALEHRGEPEKDGIPQDEYAAGAIPVAGNIWAAMRADPPKKVFCDEPLSGQLVTRFALEGRRRYRRDLARLGTENTSRFPVALPAQVPLRRTRAIRGRMTMTAEDEGKSLPLAVTKLGDWRGRGRVWEIPYPALLPDNVEGLLAAGRCISALDSAWEAVRVIPVAAKTGEVSGIAAALSVRRNITPGALPFPLLAKELQLITPPEALPRACKEI